MKGTTVHDDVTYLVTGATGVVGSATVPLLVARSGTRVWLLIRAKDDADLARRFEHLLNFWGWSEDADKRRRVRAVRGDVTAPGLGLSEAVWNVLSEECTHIVHCAGTVRMNLPLEDARRSAAGSAAQILALARVLSDAGRLCKVEYVSTVGIAGKRPGDLPERWIDEPREFHNSYEQAKAEAEDLVRAAIERERLPITVHRPSMVIGDSRSGCVIHFQIFYYICEFLSGRRTLGLYPDFGGTRLDIIPSDCVAQALVTASEDPETTGEIFHLASGPELAPSLGWLRDQVRAAFAANGHRLPPARRVPRGLFAWLARAGAVAAPRAHRKAIATLPVYLDYLSDRQRFDNRRLVAWMDRRGLALPTPEAYVPIALGRYLRERAAAGDAG